MFKILGFLLICCSCLLLACSEAETRCRGDRRNCPDCDRGGCSQRVFQGVGALESSPSLARPAAATAEGALPHQLPDRFNPRIDKEVGSSGVVLDGGAREIDA